MTNASVPRFLHLLVAIAVVLLSHSPAGAGEGTTATCTNTECGYSAKVFFGRGFTTRTITGACPRCRRFVALSYELQGTKTADKPAPFKIWDPVTGTMRPVVILRHGKPLELFPCPKCGGPFLPIGSLEEFQKQKRCPKCGKDTLQTHGLILWD